jgi:hypothetical protein
MTDLGSEIIALVEHRPGLITREIVLSVGRRRADVLDALRQLERERILCREKTKYGAGVWTALDRFPGATRPAPEASEIEPGDEAAP